MRGNGRDGIRRLGRSELILSDYAIEAARRAEIGERVVDVRGGFDVRFNDRPRFAVVEGALDAIGGGAGRRSPREGDVGVVERGRGEVLRRFRGDARKLERSRYGRIGETPGVGEARKAIANGGADRDICVKIGRSEVYVGKGRPRLAVVDGAFDNDAQVLLTFRRAPLHKERLRVDEGRGDVLRRQERTKRA